MTCIGKTIAVPSASIVGSVIGFLAAGALDLSKAQAQFGPAVVTAAPLVEQEAAATQRFVATVVPIRVSVVGSAVEGRVEEMPVEEGDPVTKGQPLARLRTRTIEAELAAARAELELRRQELAEMENGSRPEEIAVAKAAALAAKARMEYAKKDWARIQKLYKESSAATDEFDEALSRADETEQEFLKTQAAYDMAVVGHRKERIEQARARMEQQRHEVERLEDILSKYTIVAPFDGYVVSKQTEVGAWLMEGQIVAEVVELRQVDVQALIPEDYVGRLQLGMTASVRVPSLEKPEFAGTIVAVVPQADTRSRSFPVKVRVDNPAQPKGPPVLKSGMFAEISLALGESRRVILAPKDAIVLGGPSPLVYVFEPAQSDPQSGTVRAVPVSLGTAVGSLVEISGDVQAGQQVIIAGNERLAPGRAVRLTNGEIGSEKERRTSLSEAVQNGE